MLTEVLFFFGYRPDFNTKVHQQAQKNIQEFRNSLKKKA